jgi:hypothetical protein
MTHTSRNQADALLTQLNQHKQNWLKVSTEERIRHLAGCLQTVSEVSQPWAEAACVIKGLDPTAEIAGEEWLAGPFAVMHYLRLLIRTLRAGEVGRLKVEMRSPDQHIVEVFPNDLFDRLLWFGVRAEVWSQPGRSLTNNPTHADAQGQVALVLGAGNISSIAPLDVLHQLFVENRVTLLKMNPVIAELGPWMEQIFSALEADGFFAMADGGAELGAYLCQHSAVDAVHITGSQRTHDAIVWGNPVAEHRHQTPRLKKPITSELGGITPIIVVPGNWSKSDLAFQARHVASMVAHNASFNCVAGKVLILAKGWAQRSLFLDLIREQFRQIPPRKAYYPGSQARYEAFLAKYPNAEPLGAEASGCIPWTLVPNVPPCSGEYALTEEAFCGVLAEVSLDAATAEDFLARAVEFANQSLYGTLSCTVLIDPQTARRCSVSVEAAIANLRYGSIGVNIWSGALFAMPEIPWGAFPGNTLENIGSGQGTVHNIFRLEHPQKAIVYAPFRIWPTPLWFAQHKTLKSVAQNLLAFEKQPSWKKLLPVIAKALGDRA